jgi:hypothetical protein
MILIYLFIVIYVIIVVSIQTRIRHNRKSNWATDVEDGHIRDELYRKNLSAYLLTNNYKTL